MAYASPRPPSESEQPIRFAGSVLGTHRHVCAFFNSADEEYRVIVLQENPFFVPPDEFLRELRERSAAQNKNTHRASDDGIGDGTARR